EPAASRGARPGGRRVPADGQERAGRLERTRERAGARWIAERVAPPRTRHLERGASALQVADAWTCVCSARSLSPHGAPAYQLGGRGEAAKAPSNTLSAGVPGVRPRSSAPRGVGGRRKPAVHTDGPPRLRRRRRRTRRPHGIGADLRLKVPQVMVGRRQAVSALIAPPYSACFFFRFVDKDVGSASWHEKRYSDSA